MHSHQYTLPLSGPFCVFGLIIRENTKLLSFWEPNSFAHSSRHVVFLHLTNLYTDQSYIVSWSITSWFGNVLIVYDRSIASDFYGEPDIDISNNGGL